uniref:Uncharacterized protein n=1 Tax=Fagus sylvatica TaxID=28930 RepID=A0A2N9GFI9_FAGSY
MITLNQRMIVGGMNSPSMGISIQAKTKTLSLLSIVEVGASMIIWNVQDDHNHYDQYHDRGHDQYDQMEDDDYQYERATSESRERERTRDVEHEYRRSERSLSREYEY